MRGPFAGPLAGPFVMQPIDKVSDQEIAEFTIELFEKSGGTSAEAKNFLRGLTGTAKKAWKWNAVAAIYWYDETTRLKKTLRDSEAGNINE